ncbi:MAG: peptidase E, partial [Bdellovibrionales bacterium]|nr:peptidase E [Bdellovibrionales bacterium]
VCFIGTASGDAEGYIERFYSSFKNFNCEPSHLSLYRPPAGSLRDFVMEKDIFYVGGGNTRNLLVLWKEWGLDRMLLEAFEKGAVLGGISAGSICWFEQGLTDSVTGKLLPLNCLGFLNGSNCPHYDGESERRPAFQKAIEEKNMMPGIACDDGVAAYFVNGILDRFVSSRLDAKAYRVELIAGSLRESQISPIFLGQSG